MPTRQPTYQTSPDPLEPFINMNLDNFFANFFILSISLLKLNFLSLCYLVLSQSIKDKLFLSKKDTKLSSCPEK